VIPDFSKCVDPHVITGLLKLYIRELPEPLIPFSLFPQVIALNLQGTVRDGTSQQQQQQMDTVTVG